MNNTHDITRVLENRMQVGVRWHGIKDADTLADFLMKDPDAKALFDDPAVMEVLRMDICMMIVTAVLANDEPEIALLRESLRAESFDAIARIAKQIEREGR